MRPNRQMDWNHLYAEEHPAVAAVDSRRRLRVCLWGFLLLLGVVFGRAIWLEATQGAAFRAEAARPLARHRILPARRGRILDHHGVVLARDKRVLAVAVHYRYLEEPSDSAWLRSMARARLSRAERKDARRVVDAEADVLREKRELAERLARLCGLAPAEWTLRAGRIQTRVKHIADDVHHRRLDAINERRDASSYRAQSWLDRWIKPAEPSPPARLVIREELDEHVMADDVSLAVAAEIQAHPERYPGVTVLDRGQRDYPAGASASHVLGYLGAADQEEPGEERGRRHGQAGVELQYERLLRGSRGEIVETTDRSGRVLALDRQRDPVPGRDLVLTLDARLQGAAEMLLDDALARRAIARATPERAGGAIVIMDVHSGAIVAAASAPRFNPNTFEGDDVVEMESVLSDAGKPLFDRVARMAIPPGSVFKTLAAVALLEDGHLDPDKPFVCQGYLKTPDQLRCQIYRQHGVGHGEVTLADALAQSCNVYFFHHAAALDAELLSAWARRFGFGSTTGVDLPGEAAGNVPRPDVAGHDDPWRTLDTQMLVIGQGALTATPLQVAVMMAAVANGGNRVTPRVLDRIRPGGPEGASPVEDAKDSTGKSSDVSPRPIPDLHPATLETIRRGLEMTVASPQGAAHATVHLGDINVAGKTGTAETGGGRSDHAWFAGYVPADAPRYALVVVLEHSGSGGEVAGPVVRRLVLKMRELGML